MFIIMLAGGAAGAWYYKDTQERIKILTENNAKLETAVQTNEAALEVQKTAFQMQAENEKLQTQFKEISDRNRSLENKLSRHDIGVAGIARTTPTEKRLNNGTANAQRCMEILSGAELTEQELVLTKPSEINLNVGEQCFNSRHTK